MTVKQLYHLNRFHVPARAMTVDLVVNVLLVLFISSNLAILYMSNIGYVLAHFFALTGFLLLRRDRPNWPRPIKVGPIWLGIAAVLAVFNAVLVGFGDREPIADRLRDYNRHVHRRRRTGRLRAAVLLPAARAGQGKDHASASRCRPSRRPSRWHCCGRKKTWSRQADA